MELGTGQIRHHIVLILRVLGTQNLIGILSRSKGVGRQEHNAALVRLATPWEAHGDR